MEGKCDVRKGFNDCNFSLKELVGIKNFWEFRISVCLLSNTHLPKWFCSFEKIIFFLEILFVVSLYYMLSFTITGEKKDHRTHWMGTTYNFHSMEAENFNYAYKYNNLQHVPQNLRLLKCVINILLGATGYDLAWMQAEWISSRTNRHSDENSRTDPRINWYSLDIR